MMHITPTQLATPPIPTRGHHRPSAAMEERRGPTLKARPKRNRPIPSPTVPDPMSSINSLDDGCLMHIFSFLNPIPDRYNTALVCRRWCYLACHPRLWLRVEHSLKCSPELGIFPTLETAILAARPGDTILISSGGNHVASNIQIEKRLCLIGGGDLPDDTILTCSRGSESALEFLATCKVAKLTVRAELGCCFLHRQGRLTIEDCILRCEENPLDYLSCAIVSTASNFGVLASNTSKERHDCVTVSGTRIEGGAKAVTTSGTLALQHVRAIYAPAAVFFWFEVTESLTS